MKHNESRIRFIRKIKIVADVLRREIEEKDILTPSEEIVIGEIATKFEDLHQKMILAEFDGGFQVTLDADQKKD